MPKASLSLLGMLPQQVALPRLASAPVFAQKPQEELASLWERAQATIPYVETTPFELGDLPKEALQHVAEVEGHPRFPLDINGPHRFGEVKIAPLLVTKIDLERAFLRKYQEELGDKPTYDAVLKFCLPTTRGRGVAAVTTEQGVRGPQAVSFTSDDPGLRVLAASVATSEDLGTIEYRITMGGGNPHVTIAKINENLIVLNGHHRLFALFEAGVSHCPCIVLEMESWAQIPLAGPSFFTEEVLMRNRPTVGHYRFATEIDLPGAMKMIRIPTEEFLVPVDLPPRGRLDKQTQESPKGSEPAE